MGNQRAPIFRRVTATQFRRAVFEATRHAEYLTDNLTLHKLADYQAGRCYLTLDNKHGYCILESGDLVNILGDRDSAILSAKSRGVTW